MERRRPVPDRQIIASVRQLEALPDDEGDWGDLKLQRWVGEPISPRPDASLPRCQSGLQLPFTTSTTRALTQSIGQQRQQSCIASKLPNLSRSKRRDCAIQLRPDRSCAMIILAVTVSPDQPPDTLNGGFATLRLRSARNTPLLAGGRRAVHPWLLSQAHPSCMGLLRIAGHT